MSGTEYFEKTTISHLFRKPTLSGLSSMDEGEIGREFLALGQKNILTITSDPEMGGGSYTKLKYAGRIGLVTAADGDHYLYINADGYPEELVIEEEIICSHGMMILKDQEVCQPFIVDALTAALEA
jgi:hypothetical protein